MNLHFSLMSSQDFFQHNQDLSMVNIKAHLQTQNKNVHKEELYRKLYP
jgi:hypothetical protein